MTSARRALALSVAERYALIAIALASNLLLARLLTPEQIGIYSVSLAVIGIAQVLRDFGIGNFLIQEKELGDSHIRTAFGLSLIVGGVLFVLVFFAAPLAGKFYDESRMVQTVRITAINFLVLPFCTISLALLRREMAFQRLLYVTLASAFVGFVVTLGLVYGGFGPNGLAIGAVVGNVITGVGAWLARSDRKLLAPALSEWRTMLNFGMQNSASSVVTTIAMDINDLALGKILGFAPVAIISRAQGLMNIFHRDLMAAVRNVAYPAYARAHRAGEPLEPHYLAGLGAVTVVAWPFYGFVSLFALEVLRLMFGPQWDAAAPLVPVFCLAGAAGATHNLILNAILAVGRVDLVTWSELLFQPLRAILIVVTALIFKTLMACALAYLFCFVVYIPFIYAVKQRCIPNDHPELRSRLWASLKVTALTLALPAALSLQNGWHRSQPVGYPVLALAAALTIIGWFVALIATHHPVTADPFFKRITRNLPGFA